MLKKEKGEIVGAPVCTPFSNGTIKNFIVQFNKYLQNALIHMISIKNLSCEDMIYRFRLAAYLIVKSLAVFLICMFHIKYLEKNLS